MDDRTPSALIPLVRNEIALIPLVSINTFLSLALISIVGNESIPTTQAQKVEQLVQEEHTRFLTLFGK